jgi:hypothetical protein
VLSDKPKAAYALQEGLAGQFGEMSVIQYFFKIWFQRRYSVEAGNQPLVAVLFAPWGWMLSMSLMGL